MIKIQNGQAHDVCVEDVQSIQGTRHLFLDLDGTLLGCSQRYVEFLFFFQVFLSLRQSIGMYNGLKSMLKINSALERRVWGERTNHQMAVKIFAQINQLTPASADALFCATMEHNFLKLRSKFYPIKEALVFLDWAKPNYTLTLATNPVWPKRMVERRMIWGDLDPKDFDLITNSENMYSCKPHTSYYQALLDHHNVSHKYVLHIGNDLNKDYQAVTAGIPVFIIQNNADASLCAMNKRFNNAPDPGVPCWMGTFDELKRCLHGE